MWTLDEFLSSVALRTVWHSRRHGLGNVPFISLHSSARTTVNGYLNAGVGADPTAGGQGGSMRLTRVRGVPLAGGRRCGPCCCDYLLCVDLW
jgi:hypothetical protein